MNIHSLIHKGIFKETNEKGISASRKRSLAPPAAAAPLSPENPAVNDSLFSGVPFWGAGTGGSPDNTRFARYYYPPTR